MTIYKDSKRIVGLSTDVILPTPETISGFTISGTSGKVSESSGTLSFTINSSSQSTLAVKALSANANSSYTLRYKLTITTDNIAFASGSSGNITSGTTSVTSGIGEDPPNSSYSIYLKHALHADVTANYSANGSSKDNDWSNGISNGSGARTKYVEIINNAGSITTRYTDSSDYTGGLVTPAWSAQSGAQSGAKGNIFFNFFSQTVSSGSIVGTISEIKLYNDASSSKPTDVQDNSILVEKDTAYRYWFTSGAFSSLSGLTAYYNFEQTTGTMTNQASAVGSPDQITADGTFESFGGSSPNRSATGKIGTYATFFDGNSNGSAGSRYNLSGAPLSGTGDWTVSWWEKGSISGNTNTVIGTYPSSNWQITISSNVGFWTNAGSGSANTTWSPSGGGDNNWKHYVMTRTSGNLALWYNGSVQSITGGQALRNGSLSGNPSIGSDPASGSNREAHGGTLDDMSIWNRALTSAEIATLYNGGTGRAISKSSWINEFGISDGLMFGGVSTSSYADFSDSQSWNGTSWSTGGSLTGARQSGASAGTGSTSARYVNGYNSTPAPYPNSNRNESYNGTAWSSDTVVPNAKNGISKGGCGTADSMIVTGGHANGSGDQNQFYKWTGSWSTIANGITGSQCTVTGSLSSALITKQTSAQTWNGSSWTSSTATNVSRKTAGGSGISSESGFRCFDWANTNPFVKSSESWNGTAWTARGNAPYARTESASLDNTTDSLMSVGGAQSYGGTNHSTTVQEYRKGVWSAGSSITGSRRASGGAGS